MLITFNNPSCNNDGSSFKYNDDNVNHIDYKFLCNNDDNLSDNKSTYDMKLINTKHNYMINNNNVDYHQSYETGGCLSALCNNEGRLVACSMKLIDTKRDDCLCASCNNEGCFVENNDADNIKYTNNIINHHSITVTMPNIMMWTVITTLIIILHITMTVL